MIADRYYFQQHRMVWAATGFICGCVLVFGAAASWMAGGLRQWVVRCWQGAAIAEGRKAWYFCYCFLLGMGVMAEQMQKSFLCAAANWTDGDPFWYGAGKPQRQQSYFWFQSEGVATGPSSLEGASLAGVKLYVAVPSFGAADSSDHSSIIWYPVGTGCR